MLHYFFAIVLLVHGFLHVLGFAHELQFKLEEDGLNVPEEITAWFDSKLSAVWLIAYLLFLGAAILFISYVHYWWMPAIAGVCVSQVLILCDWREAKFGTLTNLVILLNIIPFL